MEAYMSKIWAKLKHEFHAVVPPTIFFLITFNIVLLNRALMLREYGLRLSSMAGAAGRGQAVRQDRAHALAMRWRSVLACAVLILAAAGPAVAADEALWTLLRAGGQVIMLRHAGTIGTVGDPPGFQVEDCSTQRNLTEAGREQARKIGEAFRAREIPIARVLSSPWCRCLDTARLAFGRVEPWWP